MTTQKVYYSWREEGETIEQAIAQSGDITDMFKSLADAKRLSPARKVTFFKVSVVVEELPDESPDAAREAKRIVQMIGNIGNRPDLKKVQEEQERAIVALVEKAYGAGLKRAEEIRQEPR